MHENIKKKRETLIELQSLGEAHLYVAIAKIDGIVSKAERIFSGVHAVKSQRLYDVLDLNSDIALRVRNDIADILNDARFHSWTSNDHTDEAIRLLKDAGSLGNWSVSLTPLKHEHYLLQVAMLDEYTFVESRAVKELLKKLERELSGNTGTPRS